MRNEIVDRLLGEPLCNLCQSFFDGFVEKNVERRHKMGLKQILIRQMVADCCDWCRNLAGVYDYNNAPDDIYRRHDNCRCMVTFKTEKSGYQDVHSKQEFNRYRDARVAKLREMEEILALNHRGKLSSSTNPDWPNTVRKVLGHIDPSKIELAKEHYSNLIRGYGIEHTIVIEKSGRVIHFKGDEKSCGIWEINSEGATVIHNHPESEGLDSFGSDDFDFLKKNQNVKEFIAVNKKYTYSVSVLKSISGLDYNYVYRHCYSGDIRATKNVYLQHEVFEFLRREGYVRYARKTVR